MRRFTLNGQSIIEYAVILSLVIGGIMFAGPYAIRTINAHFKFWDDQVYDSISEDIQQHPFEPGIDNICRCKAWNGAEGWRCGVSPCDKTQRLEDKLCAPLGCELFCVRNPEHAACCTQADRAAGLCNSERWDNERCVNDPRCCSTAVPVSSDPNNPLCGVVHPDECRTSNDFNDPTKPPCEGVDINTSGQESCAIGEEVYEYECGLDSGGEPQNPFRCVDNPLCNVQCTTAEEALHPQANYCPNDTTGLREAGARFDLPPAYIGSGINSCGNDRFDFNPEEGIPNKCRAYCAEGTIPLGNSCTRCRTEEPEPIESVTIYAFDNHPANVEFELDDVVTIYNRNGTEIYRESNETAHRADNIPPDKNRVEILAGEIIILDNSHPTEHPNTDVPVLFFDTENNQIDEFTFNINNPSYTVLQNGHLSLRMGVAIYEYSRLRLTPRTTVLSVIDTRNRFKLDGDTHNFLNNLHNDSSIGRESCYSLCEQYIEQNATRNGETWACGSHSNGSCHEPIQVTGTPFSSSSNLNNRGDCDNCQARAWTVTGFVEDLIDCCDEDEIPYGEHFYPCDPGEIYIGEDKCPEEGTFWTGHYL